MADPVNVRFHGVTIEENSISFDNQAMFGGVDERAISMYKDKTFDRIFIGYKMCYMGSIFEDVAANFQPPTVFDLDLFYAYVEEGRVVMLVGNVEGLSTTEAKIKQIFSKWAGKNVQVNFLSGEILLKSFKL